MNQNEIMTDKKLEFRTSDAIINTLDPMNEKVCQMLYEVYAEYFSAAKADEDIMRRIRADYDRIRVFLEIAIDYNDQASKYLDTLRTAHRQTDNNPSAEKDN